MRTPGYARRYLASPEHLRAMLWLDRERQARGLTLHEIALQLGHRSASGLSHYLHGRAHAGPNIVRRLASIIGVSVIEALWRAGQYGAVLDEIAALYDAGKSWMRADGLQQATDLEHHFKSYYLDRVGRSAEGVELDSMPAQFADRYSTAECGFNGNRAKVWVATPIFHAIFLAIGLFPRRGEVLRPAGKRLIQDLVTSNALEQRAEGTTRDVAFMRPLEDAQRVLRVRNYVGAMELAVVAEYVQAWCNYVAPICSSYARLTLYEHRMHGAALHGLGSLYALN
jgi:transcriptional regulator with XRE-family HTH domain